MERGRLEAALTLRAATAKIVGVFGPFGRSSLSFSELPRQKLR